MSEPAQLAKSAREQLASALNALQSSEHVPEELMDLAEPIAEAMGILHKIERSDGATLDRRDDVLATVRTALDRLQKIEMEHPAIDAVMEAVATSLGKIHALIRYAPPAAAAAPFAAAPIAAAAPAAFQRPSAPQPAPQPSAGYVVPDPFARPPSAPAPAPFQPSFVAAVPASPQPVAAPPPPAAPPYVPVPITFAQPAPAPAPQPAPGAGFGATAPFVQSPMAAPQPMHAPAAFPAPQPMHAPQQQQAFPASQQQAFPASQLAAMEPTGPLPQPGYPPPAHNPGQYGLPPPAAGQQQHAAHAAQGAAPTAGAYRAPQKGPGSFDVALGTQSTSNFYKGLGGNDVIEHGGIFVATYKIPEIGATVALRVLLPGDLEFHANAVVQWSREGTGGGDGAEPGFGARFTQITPEGRQLVYRYTRNREPIFYDDL
jgi:hypothetical protein